MKRKIITAVIIMSMLFMVVSEGNCVKAGTVLNPSQTENYLNNISKYQMSANSNPGYGSTGGEWTVMSLARYGSINKAYIEKYKENLKKALDNCNGVLSTRKYTEYSRVVIALTAIGENPANFEGYDLLSPLYDYNKVALQGANGIVYGLIALDCGNYSVPVKDGSEKTSREKMIDTILRVQLEDGGWSYSGKDSDADMTAMVIQALAPHMKDNNKIKKAVQEGFEVLSSLQKSSGAFSTAGEETCESTAQVLTAMCEAGVSVTDERFVKNNHTVLDALLSYYKDGAFSHIKGGEKNAMSTDQAMYALVAYDRSISNKNRLYDMTDGLVLKNTEEETTRKVIKEEKNTEEDHKVSEVVKETDKRKVSKKDRNTEQAGNNSKNGTITKNQDSTEKNRTEDGQQEQKTEKESVETSEDKEEMSHQEPTEGGTEDLERNGSLKDANIETNSMEESHRDTVSTEEKNNKLVQRKKDYVIIVCVIFLFCFVGVLLYNRKKIFKR